MAAVVRAATNGVMTESLEQAVENAWAEANPTHSSWEARASSALVAGLVACLLEGQSPQEALETSWSLVEARDEPGKQVREILRPLERYEHASSGWTVYTTRLALLALLEATDFWSGLEKVVRLAGDTHQWCGSRRPTWGTIWRERDPYRVAGCPAREKDILDMA